MLTPSRKNKREMIQEQLFADSLGGSDIFVKRTPETPSEALAVSLPQCGAYMIVIK